MLNEKPLKFELARIQENGDSPLFFPGKVLADAASKRLFIADSTHHRIVITDLTGKKIAIAGVGEPGKTTAPSTRPRFNDPQGMALKGDTLYVADRKNHLIRALDLKAQTVKTDGRHRRAGARPRRAGPAPEDRPQQSLGPAAAQRLACSSPWPGIIRSGCMDLAKKRSSPTPATAARTSSDGPLGATPASPSRAAWPPTARRCMWPTARLAPMRAVPLDGKGEVKTVVGEGLFEFGDMDGVGEQVRLQHALGVAYHDGKLYVADTYNSKIKVIDPEKRTCETFLGGEPDGWLATPLFHEPGGISFAGGKLYVADTNAHRIRVVDLKTKTVSTLKLQGVEAPK